MEPIERKFVYKLVAACIAGILLVGLLLIFVGGALFPPGEGFSEVFFLDSEKLPTVISDGEPLDFSFMVGSNHNEKMDYTYDVIAGDSIIQSGAFSLPNDDILKSNRYNKTVSITNVKLTSTLIKITNTTITETQYTYDGRLGLLVSQDGKNGSVNQIVSDPSYIYYPVQLPFTSDKSTLIFNPKNTETSHTTTTIKTIFGNLREIGPGKAAVTIGGMRLSDTGYDISKIEWTIQNNQGVITASSKTISEKYRYAFKKIAVEVKANPANGPYKVTPYEIHFWTAVRDNQQDILN